MRLSRKIAAKIFVQKRTNRYVLSVYSYVRMPDILPTVLASSSYVHVDDLVVAVGSYEYTCRAWSDILSAWSLGKHTVVTDEGAEIPLPNATLFVTYIRMLRNDIQQKVTAKIKHYLWLKDHSYTVISFETIFIFLIVLIRYAFFHSTPYSKRRSRLWQRLRTGVAGWSEIIRGCW